MSLPPLLNIPKSQEDWQWWSFNHAQDHIEIIQALKSKKNLSLTQYQLDPINFQDMSGWSFRHLQTHIDMDAALSLQSSDIGELDFENPQKIEEFILANWQEHASARDALKI